jgi:hypothetical protein
MCRDYDRKCLANVVWYLEAPSDARGFGFWKRSIVPSACLYISHGLGRSASPFAGPDTQSEPQEKAGETLQGNLDRDECWICSFQEGVAVWDTVTTPSKRLEPRWPAMLALLAVGGLRLSLPESLSAGPDWLIIVVVGVLLIPTAWARQRGRDQLNKFLGYLLSSIVTVDMIWSLGLLVAALPSHRQAPKDLLRSATALWITNILVFASWYWRLDAGGPRERELRGVHTDGAFLFPQMTLDQQAKREMGEQCWSPGFVDYLFLAFNTSTAFSPTDCPVLSGWAKILMMIQSLISLTTVALLAARAVNIL